MAVALLGYTACRQLSQLLAAVVFFHGSEYALAIAFHGRSNVSLSSLLISKQYTVAMACALLEYALEIIIFPELKEQWTLSSIGLVMVLIGEVIRKAAVITAGRAFTHNIKIYHDEHHQLVTHGIYRAATITVSYSDVVMLLDSLKFFCRTNAYRGYCGFFIWATGTQMMLCNPICIAAFTAVTWRFFYTRIPYEEFFLRQFFGSEYIEYAEQVPSGLPFIK